jgi:uncharacterized protein (DUF952 family)
VNAATAGVAGAKTIPDYVVRRDGVVTTTVYKICDRGLWQEALGHGVFRGAAVDLADGFIHFSTAGQAVETASRHFAGVTDLVLVAVDAGRLGPALKWEPSRGGALFPHLYAPLPLDAVLWTRPLPLGRDGRHEFPEVMP